MFSLPLKGNRQAQCLIWTLLFTLLSFTSNAAPPANDLIENAIILPGMVGQITNLTLVEATATPSDPDYRAHEPTIWFKYRSTTASTGTVSVVGAPAGGALISVYEAQTNGEYLYRTFNINSVQIKNTPDTTFLIKIVPRLAFTQNFSLDYSFATLGLTKPTNVTSGLSAPGIVDVEFSNPESGVEFQSVRVFARNGELGTNVIATGTTMPFQFRWTNEVAGAVDVSAEAVTTAGDLRRSQVTRINFKSANDNFTNAIVLSPRGGDLVLRPFSLSREVSEPGGTSQGSMWYRWTPDTTGIAQVSMNPGVPFRLYEGDRLTNLTAVPLLAAVNGSSTTQADVTAGHTYYFACYSANTVAQHLTYHVATLRFASPTVRSNLMAPNIVDLALSEPPADLQSVDYYLGTNLIASAQTPFSSRFTNVLTGPLVLSAVGHGVGGATYFSEMIGLNAAAVNDDFANAIVLPGNLELFETQSSAYLTTFGTNETGAGIWWRWTPIARGFCTIMPVESGVGILVRSGDQTVAEDYNRAVSFTVEAGVTYDILMTHSVNPQNGFHWSIQNSPMRLSGGVGFQGRPVSLHPTLLSDASGVVRADYFVSNEVIASATGPSFSAEWTPALPGSYDVQLKVTLANGVQLNGGIGNFQIGPANDNFADAQELPGDQTQQDITINQTTATIESGEPFNNSIRTVWWRWTPAYSGRTILKVETPGSDIIYLVATGNSVSNLTILAANDFTGKGLQFNAEAGRTYYIEIGGNFVLQPLIWHLTQETLGVRLLSGRKAPVRLGIFNTNPADQFERVAFSANGAPVGSATAPGFEFVWNQLGTYSFEVAATNQAGVVRRSLPFELAVIPPNDDFADATEIPIQSTRFNYSGTFQNATLEPAELYPSEGATLWWTWTPAYSGLVTIRGQAQDNNGFDAIVATGDSLTNLQYVARIDRYQGVTNMEFRAEAGVTYRISFQNFAGGTIDWSMEEETFELLVPMHRTPIDLTVSHTNPDENFESAVILANDTPIATVTAPDWTFTWNGGPVGKYLLSAVATNSSGEKRTSRGTEYWIGPSNDYFTDAIELLPASSNTGNLGTSSVEPGEPRWYTESIGSVWYKWVPPATGVYTLAFQSGGENIFGRSSFYEGSSLNNLQRVVPTYGTNSIISTLVGGKTYYLAVTTTDRRDEPFTFTIDGPPANDLLENAILLTGSAPTFSGNTISSRREPEEQAFIGWSIPFGSVWYQWTAPETGDASFIVDSAPGELAIMVLSGTSWTNAVAHYPYRTLIGWPTGLPMRVVKGTTYSFALYGDPGSFTGHITVQPIDAPPNDFKRDAILLSGNDLTVTGNLFNSTLEVGERGGAAGGVSFGGTIWYRWIAPGAGGLKFWVDNQAGYWTQGLHVLAVPNPNDLSDTIVVSAGQEIYLQVSCPANQPQLATLNLEFTPQLLPSNDSFADALPLDSFPYSYDGNILWATREAGEPMGQFPDGGPQTLWWSFKPTERGVLSVAALTANAWSPRIVVYRGTNLDGLEYVSEAQPGVSLPVIPNEEYRIQLQTVQYGGFPGPFTFNASFEQPPKNDAFTNRIALQGDGSVTTWILSPTLEPAEPVVSSSVNGSLWWSYTAPSDGRFQIEQLPGNTQIAIYTGASVDQLTAVITNTSSGSLFVVKATKGTTYQIQAYTVGDNSFQQDRFNFSFVPLLPATNDNFADAAPLDGSAKSNLGASRELDEPLHASGGPNKSLWWKFTAGANASAASVRIAQKTVTNVTIALYQGGSVDTLHLLSKGADRVLFDVWAGETYYVAAETAESDTGDITLNLYEGLPTGASRAITGNFVLNPSFEDTANPVWAFVDVGGSINGVAPDGRNFVTTYSGKFYQDIQTIPQTKYRLRFVFALTAFNQPAFVVKFGGIQIGVVSAADGGWKTADFIVTANSASSRLEFDGTGLDASLDQVSLVPLNDPPVIVTQPVSTTVFDGASALFHVAITGADPMSRQWYFNDQPIPGATDVSLKIDAAHSANAGSYYLVATNAYGRVESAHVTLAIEGSTQLQIVLQPEGDAVINGQYFVLQTAAIGAPPLTYQWCHNGVEIPAATNSTLKFSAFSSDQAGSYTVRVSNGAEMVTSLPALLNSVSPTSGGGLLWFANAWGDLPAQQTAPVFDVDGSTRLTGANYVAQLYVGVTADVLRPVGAPVPFDSRGTGTWPGRTITLPNIAPGVEAFAQVRVWQPSAGASYESARALGGKFGRSEVMRVIPMDKLFPPPIPEGAPLPLQSFTLQAGLPNFVTGNLAPLQTSADGTMVWQLTGAAGFRYLIERQINSGKWEPFTVVTNATGTATFTDTAHSAAQIQIYRARMLD